MMYEETEQGKIYSDFAQRLGKIFEQYNKFVLPNLSNEDEDYSVSLKIIVLQSLLTQFDEHKKEVERYNNQLSQSNEEWLDRLIYEGSIQNRESNKFDQICKHIRHSLSHPLAGRETYSASQNKSGKIKTGFFPEYDKTKKITYIYFYHNPLSDNERGCTLKLTLNDLDKLIELLISKFSFSNK